MNETTLLSIRQHPIVVVLRSIKSILLGITLLGVWYFLQELSLFGAAIIVIIGGVFIEILRWKSSALRITTERIAMNVRNGIFSSYELSIPLSQIKDIAYSRNHIFHAATGSGNIFMRSAAWKDGTELIAEYIPNVSDAYTKIHAIFLMKPHERHALGAFSDSINSTTENAKAPPLRSVEDEIEMLKKITGITDVFALNTEDKRYIFDHEEDRNHGVYETIRRKYTICIAHNANFRDPDEPIVFRRGTKVIFPAVSFHEVERPGTVSGSPGKEVHEYLFRKLRNPDPMDATVLIGFDI